jgi:hypothetical protein
VVLQAQLVGELWRGEAPAHDLAQPLGLERLDGAAAQDLSSREPAGGAVAGGERGRQLLEPVDARHLLDHVRLAGDVGAPEGRRVHV